MKKKGIVLVFVIFLCVLLCQGVVAQQVLDDTQQQFLDEQFDLFGAGELMDQLPDGVQKILDKYALDSVSFENLLQMDAGDFFEIVFQLLCSELTKPLRTFLVVVFLIVLAAVFESFETKTTQKSLSSLFSAISVLAILTALSIPVNQCIVQVEQTLIQSKNFMLCLIPVFGGVLTAGGQAVTALTYQGFMFGFAQVLSAFLAGSLVPFLSIYLALCMAGGLNSAFRLGAAAELIRKIISWILIFATTVFIGVWSLQTAVAVSADNVALKTTKFAVSSFVPVVGGALSEAVNSIAGCLKLVKSSVGAFSIVAMVVLYLPSVLNCVIWLLASHASAAVAELFGNSRISGVLKGVGGTLKLLISMILCFLVLLIVSITILLTIAGG